MRTRLYWEQISLTRWTSVGGYIELEGAMWTAHVYRNQRTGNAWIEHRTGFGTPADARKWVEREAED